MSSCPRHRQARPLARDDASRRGILVADVDAKLARLGREERIGIKVALARAGQLKGTS